MNISISTQEDVTQRKDVLSILDNYLINDMLEIPAPDQKNFMQQVINMLISSIEKKLNFLGTLAAKRQELIKLLYFEPTNWKIYYLIGVLYAQENLKDQAKTFYRLSILHNPKFSEAFVNFGLLYKDIDENKLRNMITYAQDLKDLENQRFSQKQIDQDLKDKQDLENQRFSQKQIAQDLKDKQDLEIAQGLENQGNLVSSEDQKISDPVS